MLCLIGLYSHAVAIVCSICGISIKPKVDVTTYRSES